MPVERIHFWGISAVWLFYVLAGISIAIFLVGVAMRVSVWLKGRARREAERPGHESPGRDAGLPAERSARGVAKSALSRALSGAAARRALSAGAVRRATSGAAILLKDGLFGRRIYKGDIWAGLMHAFIMWGFIGLFIGTVLATIDHWFVHFLTGDTYLVYSVCLEVLGLMLAVGLVIALVRRYLLRVARLQNTRQDLWILVLLFLAVATGFLVESTRLAAEMPDWEGSSFTGVGLAAMFSSATHAEAFYPYIWWIHALICLGLVAYFPFSKLFHSLAAPVNLYLAPQPERGASPEDRQPGVPEFSFRDLVDLSACTKCGRCVEVCPSALALEPFSPRDFIIQADSYARQRFNLWSSFRLARSLRVPRVLRGTRLWRGQTPGTSKAPGATSGAAKASDRGTAPASAQSAASAAARGEERVSASIRGAAPASAAEAAPQLSPEQIWFCTTCRACLEVCPVYIGAFEPIRRVRTAEVEDGSRVSPLLTKSLETLYKFNNPWEPSKRKRGEWPMGLTVPDLTTIAAEGRPAVAPGLEAQGAAAQEPSMERPEIVEAAARPPLCYWVGCTTSFDTRAQKLARALVRLMTKAGVVFGTLGQKETCCGDIARRVGEEGLFEEQMEKTIELFRRYGVVDVVTSSPHCFNLMKNEYPAAAVAVSAPDKASAEGVAADGAAADGAARDGTASDLAGSDGHGFRVRHYTLLLEELLDAGRLQPSRSLDLKVTYHDPCYLGRYNHVYEAPRKVIRSLPGVELVEMAHFGADSLCCGAGGGRMWQELEGEKRLSESRIGEAAATGAEVVVTACPYCLIMLEDAVKTAGLEGRLKVMDLNELVAEALGLDEVEE